jgi:sugar phosphate isomerase/epimerase
MKLGISSYTFGWAAGARVEGLIEPDDTPLLLDENGLLDYAQNFGVRVVQFGDNLPLLCLGEARLTQLAERSSLEQIEIEAGARRLTPQNIVDYVAVAYLLKASLLRFVIDDADYHPEPDTVVGILHEVLPALEENGVTIGIENHDRFAATTLRAMIDAVDSEYVGVCLDSANSLGGGEGLGEVLPILAPVTVNLHIKDFVIQRLPYLMGFTVSGRPAGQGMMQLPRVLEELQRYDRCRSATLELWTPPESTLSATIAKEREWAQQSIEYLRGFDWE